MTCPICAAPETRLVAPTWVECRTPRSERVHAGSVPIFGPGRNPALIGMDQIVETRVVVDVVRHHRPVATGVTAEWPTCGCGTFAIGVCLGCGRPVCGDDSERVAKVRLCSDCASTARAADADEARLRQDTADRERREADARLAAERRLADEKRRLADEAAAVARHGPCRAFPRHPAQYADAAGNCRACVVGMR